MAGKVGGDDDLIGDINVVPLVDIMLVLVIILMVTAEFTRYKLLPVQLPKANAVAMEKEPHKVFITVKPNNQIWINDKQVESQEKLLTQLKYEQKAHNDLSVIIRSEGETTYNDILSVLDLVKGASISRVGLAVEQNKKGRK